MAIVFTSVSLARLQRRNAIAAVINDSIITYQELEDYTDSAVSVLQRTFRNQPDVYMERYNKTIQEGLEQLVERELILDDFKELGGTLPENVIDDDIKDRIRKQFTDRATLTKTLQERGMTYEDYRERAREDIIISFMQKRNISSAILISPAKIERYYTNHIHQYRLGEQVHLRMIVLNRSSGSTTRDIVRLAHEIRSKIDNGTTFAEMATVYSESPQREDGGDWGWKEENQLAKGLAEVAFALGTNEMSQILGLAREANDDYFIYTYRADGSVAKARKFTARDEFIEDFHFDDVTKSPAGWPDPMEIYLMKIEERREARIRNLDEVRDEIEKELLVEERNRLRKLWIDRLKEKSFVRYL